jgi:hypothetical protein
MDNEKKSFLKQMSDQILDWDRQIEELKMEAVKTKENVRQEYEAQIKELSAEQDKLKEKLRELNSAGDEAWEILKKGTEKAAVDLKATIKDAFSKFK